MTGTDKPQLLVIGKSKRPRGFPKDHAALPVIYKNSPNAWMTSQIFQSHLSAWNSVLRCQNRKILLMVDNCSAHPHCMSFSNITIEFLPANTTSTLQPIDQGIIRSIKANYRAGVNRRVIAELDSYPDRDASEALK